MISPTRRSYHLPEISLLSAILEIAIILILVMNFTAIVRDPSGTQRIRGGEYSYLVSSGAVASVIYHRTGSIPLWNPFIGSGEPLFENPFSFILNPLMSLPIIWQGAVEGGKTGVMLNILLLAVGGWVLGRVLRLGWVSRVMLGLLLGGSGSVAGAIGMGFYQMGLSQAYVPWVIAGLIGTLYIPRRWPIALLVVSTMLLIFAGTFWYALTTAIVALAVSVFAIVWWDPQTRRVQVDRWMLKRLLLAGVMVIGVCAIRVLPQVATSGLVDHPKESLANSYDFSTMLTFYFSTVIASSDPQLGITAIYYHYILPPLFALVLVFLQLIVLPIRRFQRLGDWRIIVPGALAILFFTAWGQEGTIGVRWLYDNVPFLEQWRFVGRVMAAASPWVAIIAVIWLDNLIFQLLTYIKTLNRRSFGTVFLPQAALILLLLVSLFSSLDVLGNWHRVAGTDTVDTVENQPVHYLRAQNPAKFLSVTTSSFFVYLPFYDSLTRAAYGNPDYHARGLPSTIGRNSAMSFESEYAVGIDNGFLNTIEQTGYELIRGNDPRIKIDPTKAYLAATWVKTDNVDQDGAQIWVDQYDRAGNVINTSYSSPVTGTQDW
ncbi:MAG TPA: hypothetical protein VKQ72_18180, partial [Aggregatilineales bacterium]|nr:hypothetical protein [Aggregatilineales bacterium]